MRIYFPTLLTLSTVFFPLFAVAGSITGTAKELECVYEHRTAISLDGLISPIPVYAPACPGDVAKSASVDRVHSPIERPLPQTTGEPIPPANEWPTFTIEELGRIGCHLSAWRAGNAEAPPDTSITLDLAKPCEAPQ